MQSPQSGSSLGARGVSAGAIRHWRPLLVASVGLLLVATMAWVNIPRLENPQVKPAQLSISLVYPGASPEDVELQVVRPVEDAVRELNDVKTLESTSLPGFALVLVTLEDGVNMDSVVEATRGKVQGIVADLPAELQPPEVERVDTATFVTQLVLMVTGNRNDLTLTDTARRLKDQLASVPGISSITLRGDRKKAVRIRVDPRRLEQHGLSVSGVSDAIQQSNVRIPAGAVQVGSLSALLSVRNEVFDADSAGRIVVGSSADERGRSRAVTLADVADLVDDHRTATEQFIHRGKPAVALEVRFRTQVNSLVVGEAVKMRLEGLRSTFPAGVDVVSAYDETIWVDRALSSFVRSLLEGMALVMIIITFGLGKRAALVVAAVLPLSVAGAIIGLYSLDMALEKISLVGLIVALGLLVDDAVVVADSIQLMRARGLSGARAAVLGTARVFWANNGTTAVACASFVPLFFLGGEAGAFVIGLPTAVILALTTSLLVAQLLTPWMSTLAFRSQETVSHLTDAAAEALAFEHISEPEEDDNAVLRRLKDLYIESVPWILGHAGKVVMVTTALLISSVLLIPLVGVEFFSKEEKPLLFAHLELPRGTDLPLTRDRMLEVLAVLERDPEVRATSALVGATYPQVFLGRSSKPAAKDFGDVFITLADEADVTEAASRLRSQLDALPGVRIRVEELYSGPPLAHPINIRLTGEDYAELGGYASHVRAALSRIAGAINVSDTLSDSIPIAQVALDGELGPRLGVSAAQVGASLRNLYGEDKITTFRRGTETVELYFERERQSAEGLASVEDTPIASSLGHTVPLYATSRVELGAGYAQLLRRNGRRIVEVTADLSGGTLPDRVLAELEPTLAAMQFAPGSSYEIAGEKAESQESFKDLGLAACSALLLIFVLLVLMFGSITRALLVLFAVPYALIGAVLGLVLTGTHFGFMGFLGLIALIGVYVNHKIYFVDRLHELTERGLSFSDAVRQAGVDRMRPVVLTAMTAVAGLTPLTLFGGRFWAAFGWVNIFGLIASIPLSLIFLPSLLTLAQRLRRTKPDARAGVRASMQPGGRYGGAAARTG